MKTVTKFPLFAIVAASSVCTVALGQSKFHRWLRERIGEREAADAKQAVADAQWQKKHLGDAASQQRLIRAVQEARCYTCHVKDEEKCTPASTARWTRSCNCR